MQTTKNKRILGVLIHVEPTVDYGPTPDDGIQLVEVEKLSNVELISVDQRHMKLYFKCLDTYRMIEIDGNCADSAFYQVGPNDSWPDARMLACIKKTKTA